jgi:hypothetical protein
LETTDGSILDRAVRSWEASPVAFLGPVRADPQPKQYKLARRIDNEHRGRFDKELVTLLLSPNPVVVAQALTVLRWMDSIALTELPNDLLADKRRVKIAGCLMTSKAVGQIARECARAVT